MKTCKSGKKQSRVKGSIAGCSIISLVDNRVFKNPFIDHLLLGYRFFCFECTETHHCIIANEFAIFVYHSRI